MHPSLWLIDLLLAPEGMYFLHFLRKFDSSFDCIFFAISSIQEWYLPRQICQAGRPYGKFKFLIARSAYLTNVHKVHKYNGECWLVMIVHESLSSSPEVSMCVNQCVRFRQRRTSIKDKKIIYQRLLHSKGTLYSWNSGIFALRLRRNSMVWRKLPVTGSFWSDLIKFDNIWSNLIKSDQIWSEIIKFNFISFHIIYQIWSDLIRFGQILSNSIKFDQKILIKI